MKSEKQKCRKYAQKVKFNVTLHPIKNLPISASQSPKNTVTGSLSFSLRHFCFSANTLRPTTFSQFICENKPISNQLTRQNSFSSVTKFDPSFGSHPSGSVVSFVLHKATEVVRFLSSPFAVAETRFTFQCFPPKRSQFPQLGVESARTGPDSSLANCYLLCLSCCQSARLPPPQYHSVLLFLALGCLTCLQLFGLRAAPDVDLLAATQDNEKGNSQYLKQLPRLDEKTTVSRRVSVQVRIIFKG